MRLEQRICDVCGHRSDLHLTREPNPSGPHRTARSMEARGWTTTSIEGLDRCPDCTWINDDESRKQRHPAA